MAAPAVIAKIAVAIVTDKTLCKAVGTIIGVIVGVIIIPIILVVALLFGGQQSNQQTMSYLFNTREVDLDTLNLPGEYKTEVINAKNRMNAVASEVDKINADISGENIDSIKARGIYLCLFPNGETTDYSGFVSCFYAASTDKNDKGESVTVMVAITDESTIYSNIKNKFSVTADANQLKNIGQTYDFMVGGGIFTADSSSCEPPSAAYDDPTFTKLMTEATKHIGLPYVWGGSNPNTSFDCSGFVCYVYTQSGVYNLPRTTAYGIFQQCTVIPESEAKAGDLIFFTNTYKCETPTSHIGIYVGDGKMLHCGDPIGYASVKSKYWTEHFYAYARLK